MNLIKPLLRTTNSEVNWKCVGKLLSSVKIGVTKYFTSDSFMYKTYCCFSHAV